MGDLGGAGSGGDITSLALHLRTVQHWAYLPVLVRVALAVALGLFVGMERERRGKEAGMRTFAFVSLLGCLCALLGDAYALLGMGLIGILVVFLNWQRLLTNQTAELTTSVALLVTGVMGILCGKGHDFTPVVVGIFTAALLAWKERMTHFSVGLTEAELRSAILLSILAFVIYPVLPEHALDPWGLVEPRSAWVTVLLIAGLGFGNYILLKLYGARGAAMAGFLGGLVNSTVVVTELAGRVREAGEADGGGESPMAAAAYQGTVLATAAMLLRNGVLLVLLSPTALFRGAAIPLLLMLLVSAALLLPLRWAMAPAPAVPEVTSGSEEATALEQESSGAPVSPSNSLRLVSPFSLPSALKFGLIFLALHAAGTVAQRWLGALGVYAVSAAGGLVSSASAVASVGSLAAHGEVPPIVAGVGAVLASLASALINLPLIARVGQNPRLTARIARALVLVMIAGLVGAAIQAALAPFAVRAFLTVAPTPQ